MARLSKEEHEGLLSTISERVDADPGLLDLVGRLRSDFDESLEVDVSEVERQYQAQIEALTNERDSAVAERDEARRVYRERFFSSTPNAAINVERPKTLNDLLRGGH